VTVGDLRAALVDVPDDISVYVDDSLIDTAGAYRDNNMLEILSAAASEPFRLYAPDGPIVRNFVLIVEDSDYALVGKPVTT
jgi:hypothetical protein